jgi:hypothetical protein
VAVSNAFFIIQSSIFPTLSRAVASDTKVRSRDVSVARSQSPDEFHSQKSDTSVGFQMSNFQHVESGHQGDTNYDDYIVNNHNRDVFIVRGSQFGIQLEQSPRLSTSSEERYSEAPTEIIDEPTQIVGESTQPAEEPTQIVEHKSQHTHPSEERPTLPSFSTVPPSVDAPVICLIVICRFRKSYIF